MKKIYTLAIGILMLAGFAAYAPAAHAAFNDGTAGGPDCPTTMVANVNNNTPKSNYCWPSTVTAAPGDVVNAIIYYHNTSSDTAHNVTVRLSPRTAGASSAQTFTGSITSDAGGASGSGTVTISTPQTVTFGTVTWYKDQSYSTTPLPGGQTGAELFSSGLNLGDVPGWADCPISGTVRNAFCHQGWLMVSYQVGRTAVVTPCNLSINANPTSVSYNGSSTVSWTSSNCTNVTVNGPGISSNQTSGSQSTGALTTSATYTATGYGTDGTLVRQQAFVSVGSMSLPCTVSITASPTVVTSGGFSTLSWNSTNCTSIAISGPNVSISNTQFAGSTSTGSLYSTATYTISGNGTGGSATPQSVTVTVNPVVLQPCTVTGALTANPTSVNSGNSSTVSWSTSNCSSVSVTGPGISSSLSSGSQNTGPLYSTATYTLTATGTNTVTQQAVVTVNSVVTSNCAINSFYASPTQVNSGSSSTLYWSTSGCTNVYVSGPGVNSSAYSNSISIGPIYNTNTYTITASSSANTLTQTVTVTAFNNQNNTPPTVTTLAATNQGTNSATLNGYINSNNGSCGYSCGSTYTTYYFQYGTSQYSMNSQTPTQSLAGNSGNVSAYVSNLLPNTTYYFQVIGSNSYGSNYGGTLSFVTTGNTNYTALSAVTSLATNVTSSSARLNGFITGTATGPVTTYFEYGTSPSLGYQTGVQNVSTNLLTNYFDVINTSPNTTYYYRIVAASGGQTYPGSTVSFTTPSVATVPPVVITRVISGSGGGSAYISLSITDQSVSFLPGDSISYLVTYQNISSVTLSNAVLNVILPTGVTYRQSSQGVLTTNNTVAVALGTLLPGAQGTVSIQAVTDVNIVPGNNFVTTATLAFTTPSNAQDSAIAYVLNTVGSRNNLAGLALFGYGFFPNTLFGWILLLGLLLILILIARYFYHRANAQRQAVAPVTHVHYDTVAPGQNGMNGGYPGNNLPH